MRHAPTIEAEVTFLPTAEGGRVCLPNLSAGQYQPHLVVQSPTVRTTTSTSGHLTDEYLGVGFLGGPERITAGQPIPVTLWLGYYPDVDYQALRDGATFTIREGGRIVWFGTVTRGIIGGQP